MSIIRQNLFACAALLLAVAAPLPAESGPHLLSEKQIWSEAKHSAFTDLIRYQNQWFCTFREADGHVYHGDGKIRVLTSKDGEAWASAALIEEKGVDLRDPKFSVTPGQQLMLTLGGSVYNGRELLEKQPRVLFSKDGTNWTAPQRVLKKGDWLWRVTWHQNRAYGIVYDTTPAPETGVTNDWIAKLVISEDGINFQNVVTNFAIPGKPNESTLRFRPNGDAVALVRREGSDRSAWIGTSSSPYTQWQWKPAGLFIGGPNFILLPDGRMYASGRELVGPKKLGRTFLGLMTTDKVTPELTLPSGGDCSYPGLVWHDGKLWISYYSTADGRTSIHLAKVKL